ncbi:hypothetical protein ACN47E_008080 [Coniothyrium glycines]
MPPKRRKVSVPVSTPVENKRVTRSSVKNKPEALQSHSIGTSKSGQHESTLGHTSTNVDVGTKVSTTKNPTKDLSSDEDSNGLEGKTPNISILSIASDLVNKPIECHHYKPLSPASSTPPILIFTHGAGGTLSAPAVQNFCTGFSTSYPVFAFQGSMNLSHRVKGFHACIPHVDSMRRANRSRMKQKNTREGILLGGRSMGARAAVIAAKEVLDQQWYGVIPKIGLILVSYPLVGPKGTQDLRDQILLDLPASVNVLFVIGERDAMCSLHLLNKTRCKMTARSQLVVVLGADHAMHVVPKKWEKYAGEKTGRVGAAWLNGEFSDDTIHIGGENKDDW